MTDQIGRGAPVDEARITALVEAMTLEEQVSLLAGVDFWTTPPVERLEVPALKVSDGPNGARGGGSLVGGVRAASFPVGIALASTWNTALVEEIGAALADEARSKGARVLLAPTVNLHRSPLNGRNFECYSEDPLLTARLAVAYIAGLQGKGVGGTIKHYVGNESEFERNTISSEIDERTLRELYLIPFEAAVKEANVWAIMAAYNRLNGVFAAEHPWLLTDLLRREWGWDGVVMSDWFATHTTGAAIDAGLDLEMPGPPKYRGAQLVDAVRAGEASAEAVAESARRMLRLFARAGAFDSPEIEAEQAIDRPEHRALIRRAGAEAAVLLKNDGVLPLDPAKLDKIAIIGPNAKTAQIMGGGSAQLNAHYRVSPFDGIVERVGQDVEVGFAAGAANHKLLPLVRGTRTVEFFDGPELAGAAVARAEGDDLELMWFGEVAPGVDPTSYSARISASFTPDSGGPHELGLVSVGRSRLFVDGQLVVDNWERWQAGDSYFGTGSAEAIGAIELAANRQYAITVEYASRSDSVFGINAVRAGAWQPLGLAAIDAAARLAAEADVALLFVGLNGEWDTEGADRPHIDLVGAQDELIARVAAANPRTVVVLQSGGPIAMPWLDDVAAVLEAWYPGQEAGNAIADVLFGAVSPSGKLPQTFPRRLEDNPAVGNYPGENGKVRYAEGVFIGYRHYEQQAIAPLFPFGHGLSYTTFAYENIRVSSSTLEPGAELTVEVDVRNTGQRAGQEIVQLYVADADAAVPRPPKELKAFAKVALEPGERETVQLQLGMRAFAYFDAEGRAWVADAGPFELQVGSSSAAIHLRAPVELAAEWRAPVSAPPLPGPAA